MLTPTTMGIPHRQENMKKQILKINSRFLLFPRIGESISRNPVITASAIPN